MPPPSLSKRGEKIFACVFVIMAAGIGWAFWTVYSMEEADRAARLAPPPPPGPALSVELTELLANGQKYRGRKVRTTGYVRFVTFLMGSDGAMDMPARPSRTFFALSPEPVDLSKRIKGKTIGETAVTNVLVQTLEWLDGSFSTGSDTNITPKRTVEGVFTLSGKEHHLSLITWVAANEGTSAVQGSSRE